MFKKTLEIISLILFIIFTVTACKSETVGEINGEKSLAEKIQLGKQVYVKSCLACHQANGEGIEGVFPPLAKSDYFNADIDRAIDIVLNGKSGEITVNNKKYNSIMTKQSLESEEIAYVLTYIANSWGNRSLNVSTSHVEKIKNKH